MPQRRPSSPRLPVIEKVAERARERAEGGVVRPVNMQATLAHNPLLSKALGAFAAVFFDPELLDPRLRELAVLRMAWDIQCEYEFGQHTLYARSVGMTVDEIYLTTRPISEGSWAAEERAVLRMVDDLHADDCVSDQTWGELAEHFDGTTALALMAAPLCYRMAGGLFNSLGIEIDEGVPGWPTR